MSPKHYRNVISSMAALVILSATARATPAECRPASPAQESRSAAGLLRDIRMDSRQVRAHAWQWAMLTGNEATTWYDFDQQWNQIKPPVEDMRMKLVRLEDMRQNLPAWEQKAIDGSQALVFDIASETHKLRGELNRYDNDFSNPPTPISRSTARMLARDAGRLIRTVEPPATGPMNSASPASPMNG